MARRPVASRVPSGCNFIGAQQPTSHPAHKLAVRLFGSEPKVSFSYFDLSVS